ncbi:MAG: ABC transporter ATP-binding protein, partial [Bdellovibrionales bacterium]|nr:ABC transporter ATP-binding protein [Bdellovibrionales bacterium]
GSSYRERREAVFEAIELVHLTNRLEARMRSLSKGLTQRVAMAQAIVSKPKLLILDEPFSGLDPIGRKQFRDLMVELRSLGTTILLCSHILSDVEFFCDRASIMSNGVLKGIFDIKGIKGAGAGKFELVVRQYESVQDELSQHALGIESRTDPLGELSKFTYSDRTIAQHALGVAVSKGAIVDSFQFVNDSLEDLFVKLVGQAGADL